MNFEIKVGFCLFLPSVWKKYSTRKLFHTLNPENCLHYVNYFIFAISLNIQYVNIVICQYMLSMFRWIHLTESKEKKIVFCKQKVEMQDFSIQSWNVFFFSRYSWILCVHLRRQYISETSGFPWHMTVAVPHLVSSSCSVISLRGSATHLMETFQYRVQNTRDKATIVILKKGRGDAGGRRIPEILNADMQTMIPQQIDA